MNYPRIIEINISQANVIAQLEPILRNWGFVLKTEDIERINFVREADGDAPLTFSLTLIQKEVESSNTTED